MRALHLKNNPYLFFLILLGVSKTREWKNRASDRINGSLLFSPKLNMDNNLFKSYSFL